MIYILSRSRFISMYDSTESLSFIDDVYTAIMLCDTIEREGYERPDVIIAAFSTAEDVTAAYPVWEAVITVSDGVVSAFPAFYDDAMAAPIAAALGECLRRLNSEFTF